MTGYRDRDDRRRDLARRTLDAFERIGFVQPTARDLRDTLKTSIGGLYASFASKEDLAFEVVRTALDDFRARLLPEFRRSLDVSDRMQSLADFVVCNEKAWLARVLWITDYIRAAWNHRDARIDEVRALLDAHHEALAEALGLSLDKTVEVFAVLDGAVLARALTKGRLEIDLVRRWIDDIVNAEVIPSSWDLERLPPYELPGIEWWELYAGRRPQRPGGSRYPALRRRRRAAPPD